MLHTECVSLCVLECMYKSCQWCCTKTHTHTHLSRRFTFSPNGTMGTRDISILKGDISQSEPGSRVYPDTLTGRPENTHVRLECDTMGIQEQDCWIWDRKHLSSCSRKPYNGQVDFWCDTELYRWPRHPCGLHTLSCVPLHCTVPWHSEADWGWKVLYSNGHNTNKYTVYTNTLKYFIFTVYKLDFQQIQTQWPQM